MNKLESSEFINLMNKIKESNEKIGVYQIGMASEIDKRERVIVEKEEIIVEAKEIIEKLLDNLTAIDGEQIRELKVVREAEQFLKELENEKRL